jgi:hypothetical protein
MRARALLGALALLATFVGTATPAGAVAGTVSATCAGSSSPGGTREFSYAVHAPDSVAPGAQFTVDTDVGYAVPTDVPAGLAMYLVAGGQIVQPLVHSLPGSPSISGPAVFQAPGTPGGVVAITLERFGSEGTVSQPEIDLCTPVRPLVVARVAVGVPVVSIGDGAVVEGASGTRVLELPVTLSRPAASDVTVGFRTEDGSATAGSDYVATSGSVLIPAGSVSGVAPVRVRGDRVVEAKENLRVRLDDPVGAVVGRGVGTGRIIDDDPMTGTRLSVGDASVVEGARGTRTVRLAVSLSAPATTDVTFHFATVDGTAAAGVDYRAEGSDSVIPAGRSSITLAVPVLANTRVESNRSFTVHLSGAVGAGIGRANGVGTIIDDD